MPVPTAGPMQVPVIAELLVHRAALLEADLPRNERPRVAGVGSGPPFPSSTSQPRGEASEVLFELVKGWLTGAEPDLGEMHRIG